MGGAELDVHRAAGGGVRRATLLAVSLSIAFVAGCATEPVEESPRGGDPATEAPGAAPGIVALADGTTALAFSGCRQFHTYFPARAEDFQSQVPEGFTIVADDTDLFTLRVEATACSAGPSGAPARMLWITVPVVPPADLADANASHSLAIEAYVDSRASLDWLEAAGSPLAEACACSAAEAPSPLMADSFTADGEDDDYTLQTALAGDAGPFGAFRGWTYIASDGKAVVRILADNQESTSRGLGTAVLTYTGPGGAPPAAPGTIAHVVDGLSFLWTAEPLEVA